MELIHQGLDGLYLSYRGHVDNKALGTLIEAKKEALRLKVPSWSMFEAHIRRCGMAKPITHVPVNY